MKPRLSRALAATGVIGAIALGGVGLANAAADDSGDDVTVLTTETAGDTSGDTGDDVSDDTSDDSSDVTVADDSDDAGSPTGDRPERAHRGELDGDMADDALLGEGGHGRGGHGRGGCGGPDGVDPGVGTGDDAGDSGTAEVTDESETVVEVAPEADTTIDDGDL